MSDPEQLPRRIFLVDDHPIVRRGLIEIINHEPDLQVTGEAADPDGLWPALGAAAPDLVILDLSLGPHDGIELLARIRSDFGVPVLVLTMHDEMFQAGRALRAGARGFVTKRDASTELLAAIRHVLAGEVFLSAALTAAAKPGALPRVSAADAACELTNGGGARTSTSSTPATTIPQASHEPPE